MAVARRHWEDLPAETRAAVEQRTGPVRPAQTSLEGLNSAIAAVLATSTGRVFAKGLHRDYSRRWTQDMEELINPYVVHLSARLLWRIDEGEWDILGFEHLSGRHADFWPGSLDLPLVVDTMIALGEIPCPDLPVKVAEHRWRTYVEDPGELEWLKGDRLLHTDYNPVNVLVVDGRARLIDWAWPTRGVGWIDPACLVLRLMAAGHSAMEADRVVSTAPAWKAAPVKGLEVLARANVRLWDEVAGNDSAPWIEKMTAAAHAWARHLSAI